MNLNVNDTLFSFVQLVNVSENNRARYTVCLDTPPHVISDGIWGGHNIEGEPSKSSFPVYLLQLFIIYFIIRVLRFPVKQLGLPLIISHMMAGLILGPSMMLFEEDKKKLFPYGSQDTLTTISSIGYVMFAFESGVKMDCSMILRSGKKGWIIALFGLTTPLLLSVLFEDLFTSIFGLRGHKILFIILITQNIYSFSVIASILNNLKLLNSELGRLTLASGLVGEMMSNFLILVASSFDKFTTYGSLCFNLAALFAVIIFMFHVYRPAMFWIIERTPERQEVNDTCITIIIAFVFVMAWLSNFLKQEFIFLPFIFGLATPDGPPLGSSLVKRTHGYCKKFLLPIFLTTCAMKMNLNLLDSSSLVILSSVMVILAGHLVKMGACVACSLYIKVPLKDALALAFLLNCKGVVEISMYSSAFDRSHIPADIYTVIMLTIMVMNIVVHKFVKHLYDPSRKYAGYEQRNIFSLKPNSNLRILVCIHKQHHTVPMIKALDLCFPTTEDPITVDALHLMELVGRSSPIFISHRMKKAISSNVHNSYSANVILAFKLYEDENGGAITINPYTAISPPLLMHEDVCNLALDKVASIIILPFHRKWSIDGKIEHEDKNIRSLNCKVMERAPCSVGILVSRSVLQRDSPLRIAMVFLGGNDDREALCIANRAARDSSITLVVYHIKTKSKSELPDVDTMLDIAMLKDAWKEHSSMRNVSYKEEVVEGGVETASILRELTEQHDFFVVGRRHGIECPQTKGLEQWSEFPELGLIGDYLASADLDCTSSVLVVQQQKFFR
ncbi:hypothetical protein RJT34_11912 [Clitoria ternatea]|uniref:Cation/H+ exchanger domain-containing protein n=1 Tax=Clitoria ternatea TaxID=43366 RepID=A0AAN9PJZ5_CLITE